MSIANSIHNATHSVTGTALKPLGRTGQKMQPWADLALSSMATSGPSPQGNYDYARDKGMNDKEATSLALNGGTNYGKVRGQQRSREQLARDERAAALRQAGIENDVNGIRAQFGLFDGAAVNSENHANLQALAEASRAGMDQTHDHFRQSYLDYFNPQVDETARTGMQHASWAAENRGTAGGSADQVRQRPVIERAITDRQKVGANAEAGVQGLIDKENQTRMGLEAQARGGRAPEEAVNDSLRSLMDDYRNAFSQINQGTVGTALTDAGGIYDRYQTSQGDQEGQAAGRRGAGLFDGSSNRSSRSDASGSYNG